MNWQRQERAASDDQECGVIDTRETTSVVWPIERMKR